jgi:hypothetical protein
MATETLKLSGYEMTPRTVVVEYLPREHYSPERIYRRDSTLKAYTVVIDGVEVGHVEQVETTSERYVRGSRIRHITGHPVRWGWFNKQTRKRHSPGVYADTRRDAVADMLGFHSATKEA